MKRKFSKAMALILALVMISALIAGCSGSNDPSQNDEQPSNTNTNEESTGNEPTSPSQPDHHGGKLTVSVSSNPTEFFTPYKQGTMTTYAWPVYEPMAWDKADGTFEPCLAESWTVDADNNTLTVKLREGVQFSNGDPLNADDVIFTLSCREEYGTTGLIGSPTAIEKVDEYTVKVTWADFSLNFETWILPQYVYSKETFDEKGFDWILNNLMGTGPYVLEEYIPDIHLTFERNANYWRDETPGPDSIEMRVMTDATSRMAAFMSGEIDELRGITSDSTTMTTLTAAGYTAVSPEVDSSNQYFAIPITTDPNDPLSKEEVRLAIYNGIDWDGLAKLANGPDSYHINGIGFNKMPYYNDGLNAKHHYDPEAAKKALADAGYPNGFSTKLYYFGGTTTPTTVLQSALAELGITAEVESVDYTLINGEYISGKGPKNGIVMNVWVFYMNNQPDRFNKFLSPVGALNGITAFTDEQRELWSKVPVSRTMEELNANLYAFVDSYVNDSALIWPMNNTVSYDFFQSWMHMEPGCFSLSAGRDPMYIWVESH